MVYLIILFSIIFLTIGQLFQKLAVNKVENHSDREKFFKILVVQIETWIAVICLALGTLTWLLVLFQIDVSKAYPFLSLNFVIISLISQHHLKEQISLQRWAGVGLITLGTVLVSLS